MVRDRLRGDGAKNGGNLEEQEKKLTYLNILQEVTEV
jgi:hypothetical protein